MSGQIIMGSQIWQMLKDAPIVKIQLIILH